MQINPTALTIGNLFNTPNEQFFIPAYQRRYAWKEKQCEDLFNDILFLGEGDYHLFGTVLFITDFLRAGINRLEIVDGQQRITSLCLLLKAIHEKLKEINNDKAKEIYKYLHCEGINESSHLKLELGDLDNSDFKIIMENGDLSEIQNQELLNAYIYFKKRIEETEKDLNIYYTKLINYSKVIRLDIGAAKDAYKLFETINNRGLELSITDIIKNFLLGHASALNNETLEKVQNNWKSLVVNLDGFDIDKFFRHLMMGRVRMKISENKLSEEFTNYYYRHIKEAKELPDYKFYLNKTKSTKMERSLEKEENKKEYKHKEVKDFYHGEKMSMDDISRVLKYSSDVYACLRGKKIGNLKINSRLNNLQKIKSKPVDTFLLNLFQRKEVDERKIEESLFLIETFMLRRHICEYRTSELDDIFSKLVRIESSNIVNDIKDYLLEYMPSDREFEEKFLTANYKNLENRAKYVLTQLEYYLIKSQGEFTISSDKDVHLEHIIPQTIDTKKSREEYGDWVNYLGQNALELHKDYVWRIGNLTLLAGELNIKASNNPYHAKVEEYKKSNIYLNKKIVQNYEDFKFQEIEKRSKELAKYAPRIWKF
jgi:uncharacterized protein with ParB-like and HNH nuclease domain